MKAKQLRLRTTVPMSERAQAIQAGPGRMARTGIGGFSAAYGQVKAQSRCEADVKSLVT